MFAQLQERIAPLRKAVAEHPVYERLSDVPALRVFMREHVFAVWDFMSLLKLLQRRLTCVELPWLPPRDATAARVINQIVLAEESDEVVPGEYTSHFDLYLRGMQEIEADRRPIEQFMSGLRQSKMAKEALVATKVHPATRRVVLDNLALAKKPTHQVAASFLLGREDIVPCMFAPILARLAQELACPSFRLYLERHIVLDSAEHAPLSRLLLVGVCGDDEERWQEATVAAEAALEGRVRFWDGVVDAVS
jgi:hypothetical protein